MQQRFSKALAEAASVEDISIVKAPIVEDAFLKECGVDTQPKFNSFFEHTDEPNHVTLTYLGITDKNIEQIEQYIRELFQQDIDVYYDLKDPDSDDDEAHFEKLNFPAKNNSIYITAMQEGLNVIISLDEEKAYEKLLPRLQERFKDLKESNPDKFEFYKQLSKNDKWLFTQRLSRVLNQVHECMDYAEIQPSLVLEGKILVLNEILSEDIIEYENHIATTNHDCGYKEEDVLKDISRINLILDGPELLANKDNKNLIDSLNSYKEIINQRQISRQQQREAEQHRLLRQFSLLSLPQMTNLEDKEQKQELEEDNTFRCKIM